MSRTNVQTLFVSASVMALAVSARPISDPNVLTNLGSQARQVSFSLLQPVNPFSHPAAPVADNKAEEKTEGNDNNPNITNDDDNSPANVLERLIRLAGQAPGRLVESWTQKHDASAAAVQVDDEATIFVFAAPEAQASFDASRAKPEPVLVVPPGSGAPVEVVFTDAPAIVHNNNALAVDGDNATASSDKKSAVGAKVLSNAQMQPLVATTMLALLSLGVIIAVVAIYHSLNLGRKSRKLTLEDLEANSDADQKQIVAPIGADEKAAHELAEKVLSLMPPPMPRARSPFPRARTPRMIPLPEPSADEFDEKHYLAAEFSRSPSPYLTPAELDGIPGEYFPDPEELELLIDVAAQSMPQMQLSSMMRPEPVPVLPLQVALLFPYLNDGWVLRFFVVLFGWWSMMLSPRM